ncbi:GNAT family N-acetyltransferase [Guptibacillus hwajinpoensis]|uniref:Phosphinothricin acetyltransferase n=1 Tax=Guptibacillus hwajinpoensis TaxID=208199 RepID=A0A0J6CP34_9BACL|nr:GNAT family N-acetyltransferase [Alkalihalobacillus macyae]KMM38001.1 phosphinothricin acetyltransferase [Alkalihalobacillus macyae]
MMYNIRQMIRSDWNEVKEIYRLGIETGNATFEKEVPSYESFVSNAVLECTLVATDEAGIQGWCKLNKSSNRYVYRGLGEVSTYVHPREKGKGLGDLLVHTLTQTSEENGFWTLSAGIFPENVASIKLHSKHGFEEVGVRKRVGQMQNGQWRDVILFERRSGRVGV